MKAKATEQTAFFSNSACPLVTEGSAKEWRERWSKNLPSKIVDFYTAEMILCSNPDELTAQRMRNKQARIQDQLEDFFRTYLYITCYGETRHIYSHEFRITKLLRYINYSKQNGRFNSWNRAFNELHILTETQLTQNITMMRDLFITNGAFGGGFGGKKWSTIADTLLDFITKQTGGKIFVDTCISLCHNNQFFIDKILGEQETQHSNHSALTCCFLNLKFQAPNLKYYWDILNMHVLRNKYKAIEFLTEMPNITAIIEEYKPIVLELIGENHV